MGSQGFSAEQRREQLRRLKAAVEKHADAIVAAVQQDTRKRKGDRVTEVMNVVSNIQRNIDNLETWMQPVEVQTSMNPADKARIVYEARGVCLISGPGTSRWTGAGPLRCDCRRQLLHGQLTDLCPATAVSPAASSAKCSTSRTSRCSKARGVATALLELPFNISSSPAVRVWAVS